MAASPANEVSTLSLRSRRSVRGDAESEAATATAAVKSRGECGWRLAVGGRRWGSLSVLLFEEESRRTNVKQRNPSAADISHQSHHTARLNPDASTTTTTRKDITMHSETYSLNSDFGGSFTDTIGGFRPSKFYPKCDHAATPFGVHCAHAAIAREPETLEALWRRRLETLHKETQRRKQCHNYPGER